MTSLSSNGLTPEERELLTQIRHPRERRRRPEERVRRYGEPTPAEIMAAEQQQAREIAQMADIEEIPEEELAGREEEGMLPVVAPRVTAPTPEVALKDSQVLIDGEILTFVPVKRIPSRITSRTPLVGGGLEVCVEKESIVSQREMVPTTIRAHLKEPTASVPEPSPSIFTRRVARTVGEHEYVVVEKCKAFGSDMVDCVERKSGAADVCEIVAQAYKCAVLRAEDLTPQLAAGLANVSIPESVDCTGKLVQRDEIVKRKGTFMGDDRYAVKR